MHSHNLSCFWSRIMLQRNMKIMLQLDASVSPVCPLLINVKDLTHGSIPGFGSKKKEKKRSNLVKISIIQVKITRLFETTILNFFSWMKMNLKQWIRDLQLFHILQIPYSQNKRADWKLSCQWRSKALYF